MTKLQQPMKISKLKKKPVRVLRSHRFDPVLLDWFIRFCNENNMNFSDAVDEAMDDYREKYST